MIPLLPEIFLSFYRIARHQRLLRILPRWGAYLAKLRDQEMARIAARSGVYRQDTNVVARINAARELNEWRYRDSR